MKIGDIVKYRTCITQSKARARIVEVQTARVGAPILYKLVDLDLESAGAKQGSIWRTGNELTLVKEKTE